MRARRLTRSHLLVTGLALLATALGPTACGDDDNKPPASTSTNGGNLSPEASFTATPATGDAPLDVRFDAMASRDPDGTIVSYAWDMGDGTMKTGENPRHTFMTAGSYNVRLTVADDGGATDVASRMVVATTDGGNSPPTAAFTASTTDGDAPLIVNFDGTASTDPDGAIAIHRWDFGDGSTGQGPTPTHTFSDTGLFDVSLTVFDSAGVSDETTLQIRVSRAGLVPPNAVVAASPTRGFPTLDVAFDATTSFGFESNIVRYDWDFGDGQTTDNGGPMVAHGYGDPGEYTATLTVTDDQNLTDAVTVGINVYEGGPFAVPGTVEVEWYKPGGPDVGYSDADPGNNGGAYRDDAVDIGRDDNASNRHFVGWIAAGEWLAYDIVADFAGTYDVTVLIGAGVDGTKTVHLELDGADVSGPMNFDFNHGYRDYRPVTTSFPITTGPHELRLVMDTAGFDIDGLQFSLPGVNNGTNNATNNATNNTNNGTTTGTNNATNNAMNGVPTAHPGNARTVDVGTLVTLDGSASSDPDGDPLTWSWTLTARPATSAATLAGGDTATPSFTPDLAGEYIVELIVNDGADNSDPASVTITAHAVVQNTAPTACITGATTGTVGVAIALDGTCSADTDGDTLGYTWSITAAPATSAAALDATDLATANFTPDLEGEYTVQLVVNDGTVDSAPMTRVLTVAP